jgi:type II secretory pathway component PulM
MIDQLAAWWRARTAREQLLLRGLIGLVFVVLLPLGAFQLASSYRASAAADLAAAQSLSAEVKRLENATARAGPPLPQNDGSLQGLAFAAAKAHGLTIARVEPAGPERVRVIFEPAASTLIYRWFDAVARRGVAVSRSAIIRAGEGDLVTGEFELTRAG